MLFTPVVENEVGEGDEVFLPDYPRNILLSKDLELVPWMVGLTSSDGAFLTSFFPDFAQAGETKILHQKRPINICHLGNEIVTVTRRACHLILFQTTVIKFKTNHYFS
jgi:hypothetical protein